MRAAPTGLLHLCLFCAIPYFSQAPAHHIREADAMWCKRVWREVDLREKINLPIYYPTLPSDGYQCLFDVLALGVKEGALTAYGVGPLGQSDDFTLPLSIEDALGILTHVDSTWTMELDTGEPLLVIQENHITSDEITRYRIKEDWVFDRQRSTMEVRILGIAPMHELRSSEGESRGYAPLFWIYFPQSRSLLAAAPVQLRMTDIKDLSYDDLFTKRLFHGYVVKVSNVYDRYIREYASGVDALVESEALEEAIRTFESDLWSH